MLIKIFKNLKLFLKSNPVFFVFISINFLILTLHFLFHDQKVLNMETSLFYADEEKSLFTLYLIFLSSISSFLFITARRNISKINFIYKATGLFFFILLIDEYIGIHEYLSTVINIKNNSDIPWIFMFAPLIIAIILNFLLLIKYENKEIKINYILGLISFLTALMLEIIGGYLFYGKDLFLIIVGLEEFSENLGIIFFINGIVNKKYK